MWNRETKTFFANWYEDFKEITIPSMLFPLSKEERDNFNKLIFNENPSKEELNIFSQFQEKISPALEKFNHSVFIRTDIRSPKDSDSFFMEMKPLTNTKEAIGCMLMSERVWVDFRRSISNNYNPTLVVREWKDLDNKREFRCFVKNKKLFAISQYEYETYVEWIDENQQSIVKEIEIFFNKNIKDKLPDDDIVFDVYLGEDETLLIEFNPYGSMTDWCLFKSFEELDELSTNEITFKHFTKEDRKKLEERNERLTEQLEKFDDNLQSLFQDI